MTITSNLNIFTVSLTQLFPSVLVLRTFFSLFNRENYKWDLFKYFNNKYCTMLFSYFCKTAIFEVFKFKNKL